MGDTAGCSGLCTGVDVFLCFLSRFPEMYVHIDEARRYDEALRIKDLDIAAHGESLAANLGNLSVFNENISHLVLVFGRVYDGSVFN